MAASILADHFFLCSQNVMLDGCGYKDKLKYR